MIAGRSCVIARGASSPKLPIKVIGIAVVRPTAQCVRIKRTVS